MLREVLLTLLCRKREVKDYVTFCEGHQKLPGDAVVTKSVGRPWR